MKKAFLISLSLIVCSFANASSLSDEFATRQKQQREQELDQIFSKAYNAAYADCVKAISRKAGSKITESGVEKSRGPSTNPYLVSYILTTKTKNGQICQCNISVDMIEVEPSQHSSPYAACVK